MTTTASASPTDSSITALSAPVNKSSPTPSAVNAAVKGRFSPATSPTTAHLSRAEPAKDPLQEKYEEAFVLFLENKLEVARALFAEIIITLPSIEPNWIFLAKCKLYYGCTYLEGSDERKESAMEAKKDLDLIYSERSSWDDLPIDQKAARYKEMKFLLEKCQPLITGAEESIKADIASKIKECNLHIPLLSNFYDKLDQGTQPFAAKRHDDARQLFTEALAMINGLTEPDYLLARALGTMNLAWTYPPGEDFNLSSSTAVFSASVAYEQREKLFTNEKTKATALSLFCKLWNGLSQLVPTTHPDHSKIKKNLEDCQRQLASLQQTGKPDSRKTSPGSKVTPPPVNDSWKPVRIFVAFSIAAAIIVGAAVLGRRLFTRLN